MQRRRLIMIILAVALSITGLVLGLVFGLRKKSPVTLPPFTNRPSPPNGGGGTKYPPVPPSPGTVAAYGARPSSDIVKTVIALGQHDRIVTVSDYKSLEKAIQAAGPGTLIQLQPGVYHAGKNPPSDPTNPSVHRAGRGKGKGLDTFREWRSTIQRESYREGYDASEEEAMTDKALVYEKSGTAERPITIVGPRSAVIDGSDTGKFKNSVLTIVKSQHIRVAGMTMRWAAKPIDVQGSSNIELWDIRVENSLQCAIRCRFSSSYVHIHDCVINTTGLLEEDAPNGEGVYMGTAPKNTIEKKIEADRTNNIRVLHNTFESTSSENVECKGNTHDIEVAYNDMRAAGMKGGNTSKAFIGVKGANVHVHNNLLRGGLVDGSGLAVESTGNTFENVICDGLPPGAKACISVRNGYEQNTYKCIQVRNSGSVPACKGCTSGPC